MIAASTESSPSFDVQCGSFAGYNAWIFEIALPDTVGVITPAASANEIKVYPNPATTEVWLQLPANKQQAIMQVELISPTGRLIYTSKAEGKFHKIELQHLPPGLYLIRLWDGERWLVEKVVKK